MEFPCPCTYKGEKHIITTKRKDFTNGKLYYRLEALGDEDIPVADVSVNVDKKTSKKDLELIVARTAYKGVFEKDVPTNKKNKLDWIVGKLNEAHDAALDENEGLDWELLSAMNLKDLKKVIADFDLEIDPEDYITEEEPENLVHLCAEIALALNIEVSGKN